MFISDGIFCIFLGQCMWYILGSGPELRYVAAPAPPELVNGADYSFIGGVERLPK
jgi:hypothetical protein